MPGGAALVMCVGETHSAENFDSRASPKKARKNSDINETRTFL